MILKNAAVRHGRSAVAPISRRAIRQLTTGSRTTLAPSTAANNAPAAGSEVAAAHALLEDSALIRTKKKKRNEVAKLVGLLGADSSHEHRGEAWSIPRALSEGAPVLSPAQQYNEFRRTQRDTGHLGTVVEKRYNPTALVSNPPKPEDVTLELLMASQTHLGHHKSLWNPSNARYIFGVRDNIHIISLETTAAHLRRAARVVEEVSYRGGVILFVGTRKNQMEIVTSAAEMAGACHLFTRWTPGAITNRDIILKTKQTKVVNQLDKTLENFELHNAFSRPLTPDLVVCLNPLENHTMLYECGLASIPTIGIIDTNADPSWVTYTIPANDDSLRSTAVIAGVLGRAGEIGYKRRLEDSQRGNVSWQTSHEVKRYMETQATEVMARRKEVMGTEQQDLMHFSDEESAMLNSKRKDAMAEMNEMEMMQALAKLGGNGDEVTEEAVQRLVNQHAPDMTAEEQEELRQALGEMKTGA